MSNRQRTHDDRSVHDEFDAAVNMTAKEVDDWLDTDESKSVGQKSGDGESTGHASGRHIVKILSAKKSDLTDEDVAHMRKVNGYVKRHLAQRPSGDIRRAAVRTGVEGGGGGNGVPRVVASVVMGASYPLPPGLLV